MPLPASCSPLPPAWLQMKGFWKYISVGRTEEDAGIKPRTVFAIMGVSTGVGGTQGGRGKGGGVDGGAGSGKVAEAGSACQYTEAGTGSATDRPCLCLRPCTCCCFRCCLPVQDAGRDPGYWSSCQLGELQRFAIAYTCRQAGVRGGGPQLRRDRQMGNHREASRPPRQGCTPAAADCRSRCRRRRGGSLAVCGARNSMARSVCKQRGSLHSSQG